MAALSPNPKKAAQSILPANHTEFTSESHIFFRWSLVGSTKADEILVTTIQKALDKGFILNCHRLADDGNSLTSTYTQPDGWVLSSHATYGDELYASLVLSKKM